jgi:hypothetical protein
MKNSNYLLLLTVFIFSCQKAIEIDRDTIKPKLVVNCILSPEQDTIKLTLSESRDLLFDKNEFPIVENAVIKLFENDTKLGEFSFSNGLYWYAYQVKNNKTYRIEANKESFDDVTAKTTVSSPADILDISAEKLDNSLNARVNIFDIKDKDNYYRVSMKYGDFTNDSAIVNGPDYFEPWLNSYACCNDFIIEHPQNDLLSGSNCNDQFLFSDETFKNGIHDLKLFTPQNNWYSPIEGYQTKVIIEFSSLNYDYYTYFITRSIFQNNLGNPFAEPVPVYSNIEGGFGILGSEVIVRDTIIFD